MPSAEVLLLVDQVQFCAVLCCHPFLARLLHYNSLVCFVCIWGGIMDLCSSSEWN